MATVSPISMRKNVLWNTIGVAFYQGCQWAITVLVVVLSSNYSNSGILAFAMTIGNVFFGLATYNMRTYQISDVENAHSASNYVAMRLVTVGFALLLCTLYAAISAGTLGAALATSAFLLFKADETFVNVLYGVDQKAERMDYIGQSQIIRGFCCVLVFAGGLVLFDQLSVALLLMAAACFLVTLVFDIPHSRRLAESLRPRIKLSQLAYLLRLCFPSVCAIVVSGLVAATARQLFFFEYGDEALGIYAAVATPSVLITVLANNLYSPMLLPIADDRVKGDVSGMVRKMLKLILLVVGVGLLVSCGLSLFGEQLLVLVYGESIAEYAYLLFPALIMTTFTAVTNLLSDLLIVVRFMKGALVINCLALLATIVLINPMTEMYYMNGISFTLIASYGVSIVVGLMLLYATLRSHGSQRSA